jgi:hypothetical protein
MEGTKANQQTGNIGTDYKSAMLGGNNMMNYLVIDDTRIQVEFGILGDVSSYQTYPGGELESVKLAGKNMIVTHAGELIPSFSESQRRKNKPSVEFHTNGMVKAVMLEVQSEVESPIGTLPAEYVTFYPTGEVHRVFVSDGQISGFWSEEEEREYNIKLTFDFDIAKFSAYTNGICFYRNGNIKSITLYPKESITVQSPAGKIETEIGFSLFESGKLKSVEPKIPLLLQTPIGIFSASDPEAVGIHADRNSVEFDEEDRLTAFTTVGNRVMVQTKDSEFLVFEPEEKPHPLYDDVKCKIPMKISFDFEKDTVRIHNGRTGCFPIKRTGFTVQTMPEDRLGCTPADCVNCSLCHSSNTSSAL